MPLFVKYAVSLEVKDTPVTNFNSSTVSGQILDLDQGFGADIRVPAGAVDLEISLQNIEYARCVYIQADQPLLIKLVPEGQTAATVFGLEMMPNIPQLIAFKNLVGIYVSNPTAAVGKIIVEGAGITVP